MIQTIEKDFPLVFLQTIDCVFYKLKDHNELIKTDNNHILKISLFEAYVLKEYKNYINNLINIGNLEKNDLFKQKADVCSDILKISKIKEKLFFKRQDFFNVKCINPYLNHIYEWVCKKIYINPEYVLSIVELKALEEFIEFLKYDLETIPFYSYIYLKDNYPVIRNGCHMLPSKKVLQQSMIKSEIMNSIKEYIEKIRKLLEIYQNKSRGLINLNKEKTI